MGRVGRTLHAYVELSRLSNAPTIVSNVLVGVALGTTLGAPLVWPTAAYLAVAIVLMYVAGMALNDAVDAPRDGSMRPERPIPSGRIRRSAAFAYAGICLAIGIALTAEYGCAALAFAAGLSVSIVAYDVLHHRVPAAVVLMGVCRALVYIVAGVAVSDAIDWGRAAGLAGGLGLYVVTLTVLARHEADTTRPRGARWLATVLPLIALAPAFVVRPQSWTWPIVSGTVLTGWLALAAARALRRPPRLTHAVGAWLSGICLVDAFYLSLLDRPAAVLVAGVCFAATTLGHRSILGT